MMVNRRKRKRGVLTFSDRKRRYDAFVFYGTLKQKGVKDPRAYVRSLIEEFDRLIEKEHNDE